MLRTIALLGLGAAVAFTSLPAIAQTTQPAAPAATAPASKAQTGLHKNQMQHRVNTSKEKAKVSAHRVHPLQRKTVTP
jgi:hypothetical protein